MSSAVRPKVADRIAATLHDHGVRWAFGIPGNDVLETIRACEEAGIAFVLARSEPAACFMADAVWQLAGRPAAVIPALGPGIANAMAGIAGASMERTAMIVLSGEMATGQMGIYNHQVFDHVALATPLTKYAARLNPRRASQQVARALDIATAYPAGPVLLNVPADDGRAEAADMPAFPPETVLPGALAPAAAQAARAKLARARRPVALVGRGALAPGVPDALRRFLEAWRLPFLASYKAKGVVDDRHDLCLGSVGLSPVVDAVNLKLIGAADLIVLVGFDPIELRDAWLDAWPGERAALSVDWGVQTHRIFPVGDQAVGDVPAILDQLAETAVPAARWPAGALSDARAKVADIVRPRMPARGISPAALFTVVSDRVAPDWIMTVDVGAHRILANHVVACRAPGQLLQSNGLGCMGYAVPAAIGAQLVRPDRPVIAMLGDGCMAMTAGELAILAERGLPVVVVVLNDSALALIKLKQSKMQMAPRAVDFGSTRFDRVAEGFGLAGVRVETIEDFARAFDRAVADRKPVLIDAVVDPAEYWEQM
jgi:acetolactate synthase-1/2/3 large subunit